MSKAIRSRPAKVPGRGHASAGTTVGAAINSRDPTPTVDLAAKSATDATAGPKPVFIHSCFRASSTWLWKHFRGNDAFCAYYDIFHEAVGGLTMEAIRNSHSDQWRSDQSSSAPYFLEFITMLNPSGGVRDFTIESALAASFFPESGRDGDLSIGDARYVAGLIRNAQEAGHTPVLTCTRTLGRSGALYRKFGGVHIVIHRNLFHQWNSFSGQHRTGNLYFLHYLFQIIVRSRDDAFMNLLKTFLPEGIDADFQAAIEQRYDDAFAIFVAWHVYVTLHAARSADLVIDVTMLAAEPRYRVEVQDRIRVATGQSLELGDVPSHVDAPWCPIRDLATTKLTVRLLVDRAYVALAATPRERDMGEALLAATWIEQRAHATYTQAYFEAEEASLQRLAGSANQLGGTAPSGLLSQMGEAVHAEVIADRIPGPTLEDIEALRTELAQARQAFTDQEVAFAAAQSKRVEDLEIALGQARGASEAKEGRLRDLAAEIDVLSQALAAARGDIDTLTADIARRDMDLTTLRDAGGRDLAQARAAAHNALSDLSREKELGRAAIAREAGLVEALEAAEAETERLRQSHEDALAASEEDRKRAHDAWDQVNAANAGLLRDLETAQACLDEMRAEADLQAEAALSARNAAIAVLETDFQVARLAQALALEEVRDELNTQIAIGKVLEQDLLAARVARDEAREAAAVALDKQTRRNAALAEELQSERAALDVALTKISDLSEELARTLAAATEAEAASRRQVSDLQDRMKKREKADALERETLQRSLVYEQAAREAAMTQASDAERALAYLEVTYRSGLEGGEQVGATLTQAQAETSAALAEVTQARAAAEVAQAEMARQQTLVDALREETIQVGKARVAAEAECEELRSRLGHVGNEAQRVHDEAAVQGRTLVEALEAAAEREATLMAALEAASQRQDALVAERDEALRALGDRQVGPDSIKKGVTWLWPRP